MKDHYRTLGIAENADEQEIKLAYRKLAKQYHPDLNPGDRRAEEKFKEISEAYNILSDPILKSTYDRKRLRRDLYSGGKYYTPWETNHFDEEKDKRDPKRKAYSPEDLERARRRHRTRLLAHMKRRKKLLTGMIICFTAYLFAAGAFENWMEKKRKEEAHAVIVAQQQTNAAAAKRVKTEIENLDSPYDSLFGPGVYVDLSQNNLVIYNNAGDAVICAVESAPPHRTIRNEFVHGKTGFALREMPDGKFYLKIYTGKKWDFRKKVPDGRMLGGFSTDENFARVAAGPFALENPTVKHPDTHTTDTIYIDSAAVKFETISREEFFSRGTSK